MMSNVIGSAFRRLRLQTDANQEPEGLNLVDGIKTRRGLA
jgi:hypothetical protein